MTVLTDRLAPATTSPIEARRVAPRTSRTEDLATVGFAAWLIIGIFVDGWAHNNDKPETFFTPWHGLFYSGFLATATWMLVVVRRRWAQGLTGRGAVPVGYGLGLVGVAMFASGGVFDMAWHEIFGIEVDLEALLSPSHLVLFAGGLLVVTSPLRSAWADPDCRAPGFRRFLPALASVTMATATVAFFLMNFAPTLTGAMTSAPYRSIAQQFSDAEVASWMVEEVQLEGYAAILVTTLILVVPVLLLARRWVLPFGSLTFLLGTVTTLVAAIESFDMGMTFAAGAVAGLAGDLTYRWMRPTPEHPAPLRVVATIIPAAMWLAYFGTLGSLMNVGWSVELWAGVTVMSALEGFALSVLAVPPHIPSSGGGQPVGPNGVVRTGWSDRPAALR